MLQAAGAYLLHVQAYKACVRSSQQRFDPLGNVYLPPHSVGCFLDFGMGSVYCVDKEDLGQIGPFGHVLA